MSPDHRFGSPRCGKQEEYDANNVNQFSFAVASARPTTIPNLSTNFRESQFNHSKSVNQFQGKSHQ